MHTLISAVLTDKLHEITQVASWQRSGHLCLEPLGHQPRTLIHIGLILHINYILHKLSGQAKHPNMPNCFTQYFLQVICKLQRGFGSLTDIPFANCMYYLPLDFRRRFYVDYSVRPCYTLG